MADLPLGADSAQVQDTLFWQAHRRFAELEAAWEADPDESEPNYSAQGGRVYAAFDAMMCIPVFSAKAVLAKYEISGGDHTQLSGPAGNTIAMIQLDLERVAKAEMFGDKCGEERTRSESDT